MQKLKTGDRIRLVVLDVAFDAETSERVTIKYPWLGPDPAHICNADVCDRCTATAEKLAVRRLTEAGRGVGKASSFVLLHDGQSRFLDPKSRKR